MMQNVTRAPHPTTTTSLGIAVVCSVTFLVILGLLHFLEPEFDPTWRMISEYEIGAYGWLMLMAFFCWGAGVLAVLIALRPMLHTLGGKIGWGWLGLIGFALFGAGVFVTNAITDTTPNLSNTLHSICGAVVILTFPIASALIVGSLAQNKAWAANRRRLFWVEVFVWLGMVAFFGSISVSRVINPSAGRVGPEVFLGWPNRVMVIIYHVWLIVVALGAKSFINLESLINYE